MRRETKLNYESDKQKHWSGGWKRSNGKGLTWKGCEKSTRFLIFTREFTSKALPSTANNHDFRDSNETDRTRRTRRQHVWHFYKLDRLRTVLTFSSDSFGSHGGRKKTKNIDCQSQQCKGIFAFIQPLSSRKPKQIQWMKILFNKNSIMNRPAWSKALSLYLCARNWTFINLLFLHIRNFEWAA